MQPTGTVWTTWIGDHPGIIPVKFGQNPISVSEEMLCKEIVDGRTHTRTMDDGQWAITKAHLEHFVLRWAKKPWPNTYLKTKIRQDCELQTHSNKYII